MAGFLKRFWFIVEYYLCENRNPCYFKGVAGLGAPGYGNKGAEKKIFARGSAQPIEKARFGQGNPRKSKTFFFDILCPALLDLGRFGWIWIWLGNGAPPRPVQVSAALGAGELRPLAHAFHPPRQIRLRPRRQRALAREPRSGPRRRLPVSSTRGSSIGGNRPKLTFIGWNERGPASIASRWPPVMWLRSAPIAVVGGGAKIERRAARRRRSGRRSGRSRRSRHSPRSR